MLTGYCPGRSTGGAPDVLADRRSVAALEFAIVAPILLVLSLATFDIARALLIWQQINNAAEAVVETAEKLSVSSQNGGTSTQLDTATMQVAMTTIYAQIPGLNLGQVAGALFPGSFSVTLSSVAFLPLCPQPPSGTACTQAQIDSQLPVLLWSSYLTTGAGGSLNAKPNPSPPLRPCADQARPGGGNGLQKVVQLPNTLPLQYGQMPDPDLVPGASQIIRVPQLVADVQYIFTPTFPLFSRIIAPNGVNMVATATIPAPLGLTNQEVTLKLAVGQTLNENSLPTRSCNPPP